MNDPAAETFGLSQIGQIAVPISDIERAIQFYRDTLGMRFYVGKVGFTVLCEATEDGRNRHHGR